MSKTLSGTYTTVYTPSLPSYNPTTITMDGRLDGGFGVYNPISWEILNQGSIDGPAFGIFLSTGGTITNQTAALISGRGAGIYGGNGAVTLVNAGSILSSLGEAIELNLAGGSLTNQSGGLISSASDAIYGGNQLGVANVTLTVVNAGSIGTYGTDGNYGIQVAVDASITNLSGGTITGVKAAINASSVAATVSNNGLISALNGDAVILSAGGSVTNQVSGAIEGILGDGAAMTVENFGSITAAGSYTAGVRLLAGGSVTNDTTGAITGSDGIYGYNDPATVMNAGSITATGAHGAGVRLIAGGVASNDSTGVIAGYDGVFGYHAMSVVNAGTILGDATSQVGTGVLLLGGGSVTNQGAGTITGYSGISGLGLTVVNGGGITGTQYGLNLLSGGSVTNQGGGTITGYDAIYAGQSTLAVVNAGTVLADMTSAHGVGVVVLAGGSVTNQSGGVISGYDAIYADNNEVDVVNTGSIQGNTASQDGSGIVLLAGGGITNQAGGVISGNYGLYGGRAGAITVENAGIITGSIYAVQFAAGYADRLVIDPGAVFSGTVDGGNTSAATDSTLELASGIGTLSGLGTQFINFAQITIDTGASWGLTGTNALDAGSTLSNAGTLTALNADLTTAGPVINNGTIVIDPSTVTLTDLTGTGSVVIGDSGTLDILGSVAAGETIVFDPGTGLLSVDPTLFAGEIDGFGATDGLALTGVSNAVSAAIVPGPGGGNTLEIQRTSGPAIDLTLESGRDFSGISFNVSGGNVVTEAEIPCFLHDTLIRTATHEVRVQDLRVGDRVLTLAGQGRPITWIGTGAVLVSPGRRSAATPIIVRKGALANNVPHTDLRITKGHALFMDGVLIPAEYLVNHRSILWDDARQNVVFYHIELEAHDVLLANGAPSETYRDDGNRWLFRNANTGWDQPAKPPCAPVLTGGPLVDAIWRRLLDRAPPRPAVRLTQDPDLHLLVDNQRVDAALRYGCHHVFRLRTWPNQIHLVSRAAAPAELGLTRDPRKLGVALSQIQLSKGVRLQVMDANHPALIDGFHAFEPALGVRWTNGHATLPTTLLPAFEGQLRLVLRLAGSTQYPARTDADKAAA